MAEIKMPHPEHEEHLCFLQNVGYLKTNLNKVKELVKDGKFICRKLRPGGCKREESLRS